MKNKNDKILIPDEFILDFSLSKEDQEKQWKEHCEKSKKSWEKILSKD